MTVRLSIEFLLLLLPTACRTTRVVRLDTGQGAPLLLIPRADEAGPVALEEEEFTQALTKEARQWRPPANPELVARELFGVPPRSGWFGYTQREGVVATTG